MYVYVCRGVVLRGIENVCLDATCSILCCLCEGDPYTYVGVCRFMVMWHAYCIVCVSVHSYTCVDVCGFMVMQHVRNLACWPPCSVLFFVPYIYIYIFIFVFTYAHTQTYTYMEAYAHYIMARGKATAGNSHINVHIHNA